MEQRRGETPHTSFRLPARERALLHALAAHLGITRTAVLMQALRLMARREGVRVAEEDQRRGNHS